MRWGSLLAVALIAALALAGTAAGQEQAVTSTVQSQGVEAPDRLPGVYEAELTVTVQVAGGQCLCEETHVDLLASTERAETVVAFEPATYTIDWLQPEASAVGGTAEHTQEIAADIAVHATSEDPVIVRIDTELRHVPTDRVIQSNTNPTQLVLEPPEDEPAQPDGTDDEEDGEQDKGGVGGLAAGLAGLAAVTAAIGRKVR